ncbi:hypothetical protein TGMAS_227630 [Toxoplasma gondii MAS]|uniref:Uncharacterized protein n=1 Tax=Toxoplasma gondii MAS TaxID=943118 RepID=A0A086QCI8_TOXGO|nr:hypothetical protein TGMAS_227630 [Toxoplasma gondii MAS]
MSPAVRQPQRLPGYVCALAKMTTVKATNLQRLLASSLVLQGLVTVLAWAPAQPTAGPSPGTATLPVNEPYGGLDFVPAAGEDLDDTEGHRASVCKHLSGE